MMRALTVVTLSSVTVQCFQTSFTRIRENGRIGQTLGALPEYLDLPTTPIVKDSIAKSSGIENNVAVPSFSILEKLKFPSDFALPTVDGLNVPTSLPEFPSSFNELPALLSTHPNIFLLVAVGATLFSVLYSLAYPEEDFRKGYEPYPRGSYDPLVARAYYARHPLLVAKRSLQLLRFSNGFIFNILFDKYIRRDEEKYRKERAIELLDLIQKAGPTAIKVGQALSVRPDLIPAEYADVLTTLQDRVPPFATTEAKDLLRSELGAGLSKIETQGKAFNEPVASASIGQVYRTQATLSDGSRKEVAVKVQRPNVLSEIALDLHIVREFAPTYKWLTRSATDYQGLANEWGRGFIAELAYTEEASNTMKFNDDMAKRGLNAVTGEQHFFNDSVCQITINCPIKHPLLFLSYLLRESLQQNGYKVPVSIGPMRPMLPAYAVLR